MLAIRWKIYVYNTTSSAMSAIYTLTFSNNKTTKNYSFTASMTISSCLSMAVVDKNTLSVSAVILSTNQLTFTTANAKIGIS
jgi:hypothetical protein